MTTKQPPYGLNSDTVATSVLSAKCDVCGYIMTSPKDKIRYHPSVWICRNCFKKHILKKLDWDISGFESQIQTITKELEKSIELRNKLQTDEIEINDMY